MRALDTNILVRFLTNDDSGQAKLVYRLFRQAEESREIFIVPVPVVLELFWVLESAYGIARKEILDALDAMLQLPVLEFDARDAVCACLADARRNGGDLSDLLIARYAVSACEADSVLTFDRKAARSEVFVLVE